MRYIYIMCVCHRYIDPIKMWVYVHFSFTIWSMWLLWKHGVPFATLTPDLPHLPCRSASPPSRRAFAAAMSCGVDMRICLAAKLPQETRMLICVHLNIFIHILSIIYIYICIYIYIMNLTCISITVCIYIYYICMYVCILHRCAIYWSNEISPNSGFNATPDAAPQRKICNEMCTHRWS